MPPAPGGELHKQPVLGAVVGGILGGYVGILACIVIVFVLEPINVQIPPEVRGRTLIGALLVPAVLGLGVGAWRSGQAVTLARRRFTWLFGAFGIRLQGPDK